MMGLAGCRKRVWVALRAPRGRMQGDATKAMPGASGRSGDAADGPAPPQPLAVAGLLLATVLERKSSLRESLPCVARCKRPDTTPTSIFQQPASPRRK